MQKAFYSMQILQTVTVGLGKLSLVALFALLLSPSNLERIALAISTALALWTLSVTISVAAQCSTPNVWNLASGSCINVVSAIGKRQMLQYDSLTLFIDCFVEILGRYKHFD